MFFPQVFQHKMKVNEIRLSFVAKCLGKEGNMKPKRKKNCLEMLCPGQKKLSKEANVILVSKTSL